MLGTLLVDCFVENVAEDCIRVVLDPAACAFDRGAMEEGMQTIGWRAP